MIDFVENAKNIVSKANERDIILRIIGAVAFRLHCEKYGMLFQALKREVSDIDFVGYKRQKNDVEKLFNDMGFELRRAYLYQYMTNRQIYDMKEDALTVDVFYDELDMCHKINFKQRLEVDFPTIPLSELLLEKMQIIELTRKDVLDTLILLREHEIGEGDRETIDYTRISDLLSNDWGFYYTVTENLKKIAHMSHEFVSDQGFSSRDIDNVVAKIGKIIKYIDEKPKTLKWRMRSKMGTKKKWYREVDTNRY